jgi:hypothetical protein
MLTQAQVRTVSARRPDVNSAHRSVPTRGNFGAMELMGSQMTFGPNEEIFSENEPAEYVYKVVKRRGADIQNSQRWLSSDQRLFTSPATSSASRSATRISFLQRPSTTLP